MIERYRVLGAMVTLREFDVAELSQLSRIKAATVRTVIGREKSLLERIETPKTKSSGRGGRYYRYRLKKEALASLKSELYELFTQIPQEQLRQNLAFAPEPPVRVLAAEDGLLRLLPIARTEKEKLHFIHLAEIALDDEPVRTGLDANVDRHFGLLRAMFELCKAEIRYDRDGKLPPPNALSDQKTLLANLADAFRHDRKLELAEEIDQRVGSSVLLQAPVLEEVARISEISNRDEQRRAALSAAQARSKTLPKHLAKAIDGLVANVITKAKSLNTPKLTPEEIEIFSTIPGFYFSGVVLCLRMGVSVDMRRFADAIAKCFKFFPNECKTLVPRALKEYVDRSEQVEEPLECIA